MSELSIVGLGFGDLLFRAFLLYAASNHFVHFMDDVQGLVDEAVGQSLHLGIGQYEAEVVLAVAAEGKRAVESRWAYSQLLRDSCDSCDSSKTSIPIRLPA